jgi:hypothetical protein
MRARANRGKKRIAAQVASAVGAGLLGVTLAVAGNGNGNSQGSANGGGGNGGMDYCGKTTQNLYQGCRDQASADRWIGSAQCVNITDAKARKNCFVIAQMLGNEAKKACISERDARRDSCDVLGRSAFTGWRDLAMAGDLSAAPPAPDTIDGNAYFPLATGATGYLAGDTRITREVTDQLRQVDGHWCRLVVEEQRRQSDDTLVARSELLYAEDLDHNVWNCGARHTQYAVLTEGGEPVVTGTEGSWEAGQFGAQAGLAMPDVPAYGESFRRAFAPGVNEDIALVLDPAGTDSTFDCSGTCTLLKVSSALLPGAYSLEFYEAGSGLVHVEGEDGSALRERAP